MPTQRDFKVLQIVAQRIEKDGFAPSLIEIAQEIGVNSDNTARKCLIRLEGWLHLTPHGYSEGGQSFEARAGSGLAPSTV